MKIDTNSWHYKLMTLYKWSRKEYSDWAYDYPFWEWYSNNHKNYPDRTSLKTFRAFMSETGHFQPVDFCTYWRNALLWPLVFALMWAVSIIGFVVAMTYVNLVGAMTFGFAILISVGMFLVLGLAGWIVSKISAKSAAEKVDGFFESVGKSLRNPEMCSLVEYEDKK